MRVDDAAVARRLLESTAPSTREQLADWVPLALYTALTLLAFWRMLKHLPRGSIIRQCCAGRTLPSKPLFHIFLLAFAAAKAVQYSLGVAPEEHDANLRRPILVVSSLASCAYITLLLFLEMHWLTIVSPTLALDARFITLLWRAFWAANLVLYAVVATAVGVTWTSVAATCQSQDVMLCVRYATIVVDAIFIVLAGTYTFTAFALYSRVSRSLAMSRGDAGAGKTARGRLGTSHTPLALQSGSGEGAGDMVGPLGSSLSLHARHANRRHTRDATAMAVDSYGDGDGSYARGRRPHRRITLARRDEAASVDVAMRGGTLSPPMHASAGPLAAIASATAVGAPGSPPASLLGSLDAARSMSGGQQRGRLSSSHRSGGTGMAGSFLGLGRMMGAAGDSGSAGRSRHGMVGMGAGDSDMAEPLLSHADAEAVERDGSGGGYAHKGASGE